MATSEKKRTLLTEVPTFNDKQVIPSPNDVRNAALKNAHEALVSAFGPKLTEMSESHSVQKLNGMIVEKLTSEEGVTEMDLNELIQELENAPEDDDMVKECRQRLNEAKDPSVSSTEKEKMYKDIHRKFWAYVQSLPNRKEVSPTKPSETDDAVKKFLTSKNCGLDWLSHEGSTIISALIAVADGENACVSLSQLPDNDKAIVNHNIYKLTGTKYEAKFFWVHLDDYKNFIFSADTEGLNRKEIIFTVGNRVASIPPSESSRFGNTDVRVERKGKDIVIGDRIKLERNRIQNLVNPTDPSNNGANRGSGFVSRPKATGRNAYEIRADVLEMALDWAKTHGDKKLDTDDVLDIAEAFYGFVEHK